jgi:hypothetical protein
MSNKRFFISISLVISIVIYVVYNYEGLIQSIIKTVNKVIIDEANGIASSINSNKLNINNTVRITSIYRNKLISVNFLKIFFSGKVIFVY